MANRWIASLSDGRTIFETDPQPGGLSHWQMLLAELRGSDVKMTQLRLQVNGITLIGARNADGYLQCTEIRVILDTGETTSIRGLGSIFGGSVLMNWVDDDHNVWQDVRPVEDLRVHSTL